MIADVLVSRRTSVLAYQLEICVCTLSFFLFQAEDGIRDLVRSRGLGDVYKRQVTSSPLSAARVETRVVQLVEQLRAGQPVEDSRTAVSYTHLTLPTSDLV